MKNIKALTLAFLLTLFGSSHALAEYGITVGLTGSMAMIEASGQETEGGEVSRGEVSNNTGVGSIFVEYNDILGSGFSLGVDYIPGSADVSGKTHKRTETAQGKSGVDADGSVTRTADAEVENLNTLYIEYPMGAYFAKLGYAQIDVNTKENKITGSGSYGNDTLDGYTLGLGVNGSMGEFFTKTSVEYTDFDDIER